MNEVIVFRAFAENVSAAGLQYKLRYLDYYVR